MKPTLLLSALLLILIITSGVALAQPEILMAPSQAPIDAGLSILAAAGGAYAIKKLRDKKSKTG